MNTLFRVIFISGESERFDSCTDGRSIGRSVGRLIPIAHATIRRAMLAINTSLVVIVVVVVVIVVDANSRGSPRHTLSESLIGGRGSDVDVSVAGGSHAVEERSQKRIAVRRIESPDEAFHIFDAEPLGVVLIPDESVNLLW